MIQKLILANNNQHTNRALIQKECFDPIFMIFFFIFNVVINHLVTLFIIFDCYQVSLQGSQRSAESLSQTSSKEYHLRKKNPPNKPI